MYANKEDKNILIMVIAILVVSIIALVAIGNIIWKIVSPGLNTVVTEISQVIRINRLDYNFEIPAKKEPVATVQTTVKTAEAEVETLTPEQQAVINMNLNYNFVTPESTNGVVEGSTNFFEEIYSDANLGETRISEESNKNIVITIPKLKTNSPVYITSESSTALKFGFWMHKSSYKFNEGELLFLCTRRYFDSNDPRSCYNLSLLNVDDKIELTYSGQKITYKVTKLELLTDNYDQIYNSITDNKNNLRIVTTGATDTGKGRLVISAVRI